MKESERPYLVQNLADLPDGFQLPVAQGLPPDQAAQVILMIPHHTQTRTKRQRFVPPQVLVFTAQGVLHVQAGLSPGQPPTATYLRGADLLYAQHSLILLYGCLELAGEAQGHGVRIVVEYNTVGLELLLPALQQFLRLAYAPAPAAAPQDNQSQTLLQKLTAQSFKFESGLRFYALQPDEPLLGFVFQPRIVQRLWHLFNRGIAPAALLALTERTVILIEEERIKGASYGWLITFCPRRYLAGVETRPKRQWCEVSVRLTRNEATWEHRVMLDNEKAQAWEALWVNPNQ